MSSSETPVTSEKPTRNELSEKTLKKIADALRRDSSIKTHKPYEVFEDEETQEQKLRKVECVKGSALFTWFMNEENQKIYGLDIHDESDVAWVMKYLMEQHYFRQAEKIEMKFGGERKFIRATNSTEYKKHNMVYIWEYEGSQTFKMIQSWLVLAGMFLIPTYNLWPLIIKKLVLYIVGGIAGSLLLLNVIRLLIFVLFWFFGYQIWIFPNLNNEKLGVVDSFFPLISCEKDKSSKVIYRVLALLVVIGIITTIVMYPKETRRTYRKTRRFAEKQLKNINQFAVRSKTNIAHLYESIKTQISSIVHPKSKGSRRVVNIKEDKIVEEAGDEEEYDDEYDMEEIDLSELDDVELENDL